MDRRTLVGFRCQVRQLQQVAPRLDTRRKSHDHVKGNALGAPHNQQLVRGVYHRDFAREGFRAPTPRGYFRRSFVRFCLMRRRRGLVLCGHCNRKEERAAGRAERLPCLSSHNDLPPL